ncbi:retrovirus-related pol polyprotein from transposon TNT 1-94 [Tanacetum coccineum]
MSSLAEFVILNGVDNRPPMLDKLMYDSWKSRMELYMENRENGYLILESIRNGPLVWPMIEENREMRRKRVPELSAPEKLQYEADVKAINIILQGVPTDVYALYNHIFVQLINDMHIYQMRLQQFQVNTKFLNSLPPEWSKFVTEVKLVKDLHVTNFDQLFAHLEHHEAHANEIHLLKERISYPSTPQAVTYQSNTPQTIYQQPQAISQIDYQPQQTEFPALDSGLAVPVFNKGDDSIDAINKMMSFLSTMQLAMKTKLVLVLLSGTKSIGQRVVKCFNCQREGHMAKQCPKPKRKRDASWFREKVLLVEAQANGQILHGEELAFLADLDALDDDSSAQSVEINRLKQTLSEHLKEKESLMQTVTLLKNNFKKEESRNIDREIALEKKIKQLDNIVFKRDQSAQTVHMLTKPQFFYDHTTKQDLGFQNPFYLKKAQQLEQKHYDGNVIKNTSAIVILDSEKTLMLAEESYFETRFVPQTELSAEQAFWSHNFVNSSDRTPSNRPAEVEVSKELPKVSMVNTSLKKLKHHLAGFDVVVKERTTATAITEGSWGFKHTKACFKDEIIPFVKALKDLFNTFDQYFELNELKAQSQEKDTVIKKLKERIISLSGNMNEDKIKKDIEEIEMINIELDHRVSKLIAENEQLKQTYRQLYDSIKPARIRSKEQCDGLLNQVNLKSVEISDLNASLLEKVLVITALKDDLRKLKGKALVHNAVPKHTIDPEMLKIDVEPITLKLLNKRTAHIIYIKHTHEEAAVLRDLVEHVKSNYPLDHSLEYALVVIPKNKDKRVRFTESVTSSGNKNTTSSSNLVSNKPMLSSTGVRPSTSASGSQTSRNNKKNKIQRPSSSTLKNKVEAHHRTVKSSLKHRNCVVKPKETANVQHSKINKNSELLCVKCNGCMLSANPDLCVLDFINNVTARAKSKSVKKSSKRKVWKPIGKVFTNIGYSWRPTGRTFTIVGNACPLTRITTTAEVPLRKPIALECDTSKPVVTLVYSRKPRKSKTNVPVSKPKIIKSVSANKKEPNKS